jgi:general secretion pathway protein G
MEMVVVLAILSLLAALAAPYARMSIKREKEIQLRETLRTVRMAIDRFHADMQGSSSAATPGGGTAPPAASESKKASKYASADGYPLSLQILVDGVEKGGGPEQAAGGLPTAAPGGEEARPSGEKKRKRYLRALPQNPFAPRGAPFDKQWTFVSYQHEDILIASSSYGMTLAEAGKSVKDIYDLHAVTREIAIDGTRYADW